MDMKKLVAELCAQLRLEKKKNEALMGEMGGSNKPSMDEMVRQLEEAKIESKRQTAANKKMRQTLVQLTSELKETTNKAETAKANHESMLAIAQQQMGTIYNFDYLFVYVNLSSYVCR